MKKIITLSLFVAVFMMMNVASVSAEPCPPPWYETNCHYAYGYHWNDVNIAYENAYDAAVDACEPPPEGCYCVYYPLGSDTVWMGSLKMVRYTFRWCHCCYPGK